MSQLLWYTTGFHHLISFTVLIFNYILVLISERAH